MGQINSSLGKTEFQSKQRHFTVSDETENQGEDYSFNATADVAPGVPVNHGQQYEPERVSWEEAQARRQKWAASKQQQASRVSPKSRIEMLVGIGRSSINVEVHDDNGVSVFTVSTLKTKERKHVARARENMFKLKTQESVMEVKTVTLAYAISAIDGISFDSIIGSELERVGEENRYYMREAFVDELDDHVTNLIFANFENMDLDNQNKYSIKSVEDVKEVAEAMSKSGERS